MDLRTLDKRCGRCGRRKPQDLFYRNRAQPDGLDTWCKECRKRYQRARRAAKALFGKDPTANLASFTALMVELSDRILRNR